MDRREKRREYTEQKRQESRQQGAEGTTTVADRSERWNIALRSKVLTADNATLGSVTQVFPERGYFVVHGGLLFTSRTRYIPLRVIRETRSGKVILRVTKDETTRWNRPPAGPR